MELIRGLQNLRQAHRGAVVTIGTFVGHHLGHQALIARARGHAARLGRRSMVLTFEPTPREFLAPASAPARLMSLRERWRVLETLGVDMLCLLRFGARLRNMTGEAFAHLLSSELEASVVVVGHDFKFGRGADGTADALGEAGVRLGFQVEVVSPVTVGHERVSSSGIREALARGDFEHAKARLGRPYSMRGRVVEGEKLGRTLGFPTANLRLQRRSSPLEGIFAVRVRGIGEVSRPGVASLGSRPTVGGKVPLLETFLFDFAGDLYGREIEVEFVAKLRNEQRFATLDELVEQMNRDAAEARRVLNS
jgi:riboflavin kinase/FMN adenylyltransferase